jgi:CPA2 family monovalent cation:H+ antiporter-2
VEVHGTALISTLAIALSAAFVAGFIARRMGLPAIVGYLLAGVAVGPFTPGLTADPHIALQLAEIGVALLMFGVGLHFSIGDLWSARRIAIPGALGQIAVATGLGTAAGLAFGWDLRASVVLGVAVSVASTVVLIRALDHRGMTTSEPGRVAIGWLIVEDLVTVLVLVILPVLAPTGDGSNVAAEVAIALPKAAALTGVMLVVGARVLPRALALVERDGSRELFTLAVVAVALGIAYAASAVFDVSLALGAFLAGAVLSESSVGRRSGEHVVGLTDIFTVLFFVSVGMLLDPTVIRDHPLEIVVMLAIVVIGKSAAALGIVLALRRSMTTGLTVAAGLAQVGEFSFILAATATTLGLLPEEAFQVIVAVALLSITINPAVVGWASRRTEGRTVAPAP